MSNQIDSYSVAEQIAKFLQTRGVTFAHYLSGGMIAFLTDAFSQQGIKLINYRHEQSAGFAAEGEARVKNRPSVALATSGPGATNLVTAIASCFFDSTPVIFITGQVNTNELKRHRKQRQNGFQELDIVSLCKSITKLAVRIHSPKDLFLILDEAWKKSLEKRMGPVLIDIPIDIQQLMLEEEISKSPRMTMSGRLISRSNKMLKKRQRSFSDTQESELKNVINLLATAKKPLILAGGGVRLDGSVTEFREFIQDTNIPVVSSLMGLDAPNHQKDTYVGFIGSYGNRWANRALYQSDVLLVLGSRLDIRQTGSCIDEFSSNKKIIRVDIDTWELRGRVNAQINFRTSIREFLRAIDKYEFSVSEPGRYLNEIKTWRKDCQAVDHQSVQTDIDPIAAIREISNYSKNAEGYFVDVGQHQMWAAQSLLLQKDQRFITSGGLGSMGFALPSSIGASTGCAKHWIVITGDGCAQLSLSELQTLKQYKLPITMYIFNNQQHGMVAQFQDEYLKGNFIGTRFDYTAPNFTSIASSFGLRAVRANNMVELRSIHTQLTNETFEPTVIEVMVSNRFKALPKLGSLTRLSEM